MRIKTQLLLSIIIFIIVTAFMTASIFVAQEKTAQLNSQEALSRDIQTRVNNLAYVSSQYFLYQDISGLTQWQTEYATLSANLRNTIASTAEQKALVNRLNGDVQRLNSSWDIVVSYLQDSPRNVSIRADPVFQTDWSIMVAQSQALVFDAQQLAQSFRSQIDQSNLTTFSLILTLLLVFGAYFVVNYLIAYRNTLRSISKLQAGMEKVGSGDLDFSIAAGKKDEISEISQSVNHMLANLRTVTASKTDLEMEIEERKKAEVALETLNIELDERVQQRTAQLTAERQRLYNVLETLPSYVILLDSDYRVRFANKVFRESFGEDHGRRCHEYLFGKDHECEGCETYKVYKENKPHHWYWTGPNGHDYDIYDFPFREADGSMLILEMGIDITEQRKAQKQLKDSERMIAIGQTAGMVGHDIRNPLQAMISDVYLAKSDLESVPSGDAKERICESLDSIQKGVEYINKIVQDLQDYARPLAPAAKEIDLQSVVEEVLFKNGVPENVEASCKFTDEAKRVTSDADLLKRVLTNLVNNAVQAMPDGGKLAILAYKDKETADLIIEVEDSGCGIPESARLNLFTPMFTTKSKGQGFGLAVVKRITESMSGTVSFESVVNKGTTFRVRLPPPKEIKGKLVFK